MTAPYYQDERVTLYHGDWREIIAEDFTADLILTDPPYGETALEWDTWPKGWPALATRHANSMWCFGSMRMFFEHINEFSDWRFSQDVVWNKNTTGMNPGDRFSRCHEFATHWYQGDWSTIHHEAPRVPAVKRVAGDVISRGVVGKGRVTGEMGAYRLVSDGMAYQRTVMDADSIRGGIHPTEKPGRILEPLIEYGCPTGGTVLDLFAGSTSTLVSARNTGRNAVGYELREEQCETAAMRLSQQILDFGEGA